MLLRTNLKTIMLSSIYLCLGILIVSAGSNVKLQKISFPSKDGLKITADLYASGKKDSPFIILCHMAYSSRGEYKDIAPKLNDMGFNCMAIDQRSGSGSNSIVNETSQNAIEKKLSMRYIDAVPDIVSALEYANKKFPASKIILWGSSYSSSLAIVLGNEHPELVDGVISFSPGEYFTNQEKTETYVTDNAKDLNKPVFITCASNESIQTKNIYDVIPSKNKIFFAPKNGGLHGSEALWEKNTNNKEYWDQLAVFLKNFFR